MLELIIIFAVAFLIVPLVGLACQATSTDVLTRRLRFWLTVVYVLTLALLVYLLFFGHIAARL